MSGYSDMMKKPERSPRRSWPARDAASLGRVIANARRKSSLSQADLADAAGITRQYLSQLENGHSTEHTERLLRVLRRLGLELTVTEGDRPEVG